MPLLWMGCQNKAKPTGAGREGERPQGPERERLHNTTMGLGPAAAAQGALNLHDRSICWVKLHAMAAFYSDIVVPEHESSIFRSFIQRPVCGFSMMEQVRLCAVWPTENKLGTSKTTYRVGWMSLICYSRARERRCLILLVPQGRQCNEINY